MNYFYEIYLKSKLHEVLHKLNTSQNEINNIISINKTKEENYKNIITFLQNENLSLLQLIIRNKINNSNKNI
jgi:hypothetical protein